MTTTSREVHLAARPQGRPTAADFDLVSVEVPDPGPSEVLVRTSFMSVDPYMRGRMNDAKSYVPPFRIGAPLDGAAVGEVVAAGSEVDHLAVGDVVQHGLGWRELAVLPAAQARKIDTSAVPASAYLGILGVPGLTAYVGLKRIAELADDETVFVSGAAGAVGSAVVQMARLLGAARVIGSAGGPEKTAWVRELGADAALDYKAGPVHRQLRAETEANGPVDVYFDNVGGDHLEAALGAMADFGRIAACGAISAYNATEPPPGPRNLAAIVQKRLTVRGFIVTDHADVASEFYRTAGGWLADGRLVHRETVVDGIDHAVEAFLSMLDGGNTGKMLVRLA